MDLIDAIQAELDVDLPDAEALAGAVVDIVVDRTEGRPDLRDTLTEAVPELPAWKAAGNLVLGGEEGSLVRPWVSTEPVPVVQAVLDHRKLQALLPLVSRFLSYRLEAPVFAQLTEVAPMLSSRPALRSA